MWPDVERSNALFLHQIERVEQLETEVESLQHRLKSLTERRRHVENLQGALWERASAYTNLILSAGYAALFASWFALRGELGLAWDNFPRALLSSGICSVGGGENARGKRCK